MAFVPVVVNSFKGASLRPSVTPCDLQSSSTLNTVKRRAHLQMAFSSIDDPASAVTLRDDSIDTEDECIRNAYIQVFGNAYLMESEREQLAVAESDFKMGTINMKELIRQMGKSEAYRKRFFSRSGAYRFVELNYKHFLGRGPNNQQEISYHVQKLINEGYDAEIDSYIDSPEFDHKFDQDTVPRFVFEGCYQRNDNFNRMTIMRKHWDGCSTSTVSGSTAPGKPIPAQLTMGHGGYVNGFIGVVKGLPAGFRPTAQPVKSDPSVPVNDRAPTRVRIKIAENLYQVIETGAQLPPVEPAWKKELQDGKKWNGVWF